MAEGVCRLCARRGARAASIFRAGLHRRAMLLAAIQVAHPSPAPFISLFSLMTSSFPFQIAPGDGLPDLVCEKCSCQISACYDFKIQCENSDRSFRTLLSITCEGVEAENLSNLEIKQEVSFENDGKHDIRDACTDDSMDHNSPCTVDNFSIDDTLFNSIKRSNSTEEKDRTEEEKPSIIDNKENQSVKNELQKQPYPKLRIRRESLIADKPADNKKNESNINNIKSLDVELAFSQNEKSYIPLSCSDDENKDDISSTNAPVALVCHLCGKEFSKDKHLQRHLQSSCSTAPKKKKLNLKKKSVKFRKKHVLKLLKIHSEDMRESEHFIDKSVDGDNKNFMCDVCGCIYKKLNILLQHQTTHTNIKNHSCNLCKKKFTRRSHLGAHMRIHNNIKPYVCETCGISFVKSSDLSRHKRIHSDARNYACSICPRRFKRSGDVTSHMRVHTGDRPYKCKACNKAYSSHSSLQKHRKLKCQVTMKFDGIVNNPVDIKPKTEVQI